jgi:hypothetical protein
LNPGHGARCQKSHCAATAKFYLIQKAAISWLTRLHTPHAEQVLENTKKNLPNKVRSRTNKNAPEFPQARFLETGVDKCQAVSALMRLVSRETLRDAVFLWNTPFWAPRMSSGSADFMAASASAWLPALIASSTLRSELRTRLTRFLLTVARRAETRVAFFADLVLAIKIS